jgi:hypothetical protein
MKTQRRVLVVAFILSVTFVFATTSVKLGMTAGEAQSKLSQDRVAVQAVDLYETYEALSALPISSRKAVYRALSADAKSGLWRIHLTGYLTEHPELTEEQRGVIVDAIALVTPRLFEIAESNPNWLTDMHSPVELLKKRVLEVFPRGVAVGVFTQLGTPAPSHALDDEGGIGQSNCNCNTDSIWSCDNCTAGGCKKTPFGCGWLMFYECNGRCPDS